MDLIKYGKNLWKEWLSPQKLINKTQDFIKRSRTKNNKLLNIELNSIKNRKRFFSLLVDDITECSTFHNISSFLQFVSDDPNVQKAREAHLQLSVLIGKAMDIPMP